MNQVNMYCITQESPRLYVTISYMLINAVCRILKEIPQHFQYHLIYASNNANITRITKQYIPVGVKVNEGTVETNKRGGEKDVKLVILIF